MNDNYFGKLKITKKPNKFKFQDPLGMKSLDLSLSYTPNKWQNNFDDAQSDIEKDEQFHASFNYSNSNFAISII